MCGCRKANCFLFVIDTQWDVSFDQDFWASKKAFETLSKSSFTIHDIAVSKLTSFPLMPNISRCPCDSCVAYVAISILQVPNYAISTASCKLTYRSSRCDAFALRSVTIGLIVTKANVLSVKESLITITFHYTQKGSPVSSFQNLISCIPFSLDKNSGRILIAFSRSLG